MALDPSHPAPEPRAPGLSVTWVPHRGRTAPPQPSVLCPIQVFSFGEQELWGHEEGSGKVRLEPLGMKRYVLGGSFHRQSSAPGSTKNEELQFFSFLASCRNLELAKFGVPLK